MRQWYCFIGGRRYGPVSENDLRLWIRQGRVRSADLVWTDGIGDWTVAGSVPGLFAGAGAVPVQPGGVNVSPAGGTGGWTPNWKLNTQAREVLQRRWGLAIGFCLLYMLIMWGVGTLTYNIAFLVLGGPLMLGFTIFFLTFARRGRGEIGMLFAGFQNFGNALVAYLLVFLFLLLWFLTPVVGGALIGLVMGAVFGGIADCPVEGLAVGAALGVFVGYFFGIVLFIIAKLSYSQTFYLLADNPSVSAMDAIHASKEVMLGYKGKLFCLSLRYFCWGLLCLLVGVLTCGIGGMVGFIFLAPYMAVGYAGFYDDLHPPADGMNIG